MRNQRSGHTPASRWAYVFLLLLLGLWIPAHADVIKETAISYLNSPDPETRLLFFQFSDRDVDKDEYSSALVRLIMEDPDHEVRSRALNELGNLVHTENDFGSTRPDLIARLIEGLDDDDPKDIHKKVQRNSAYCLGRIGPSAAIALEDLQRVIRSRDRHEELRRWSIQAVGMIGATNTETGSLLVSVLDENNPKLFGQTVSAIEALGPAINGIELELISRLKSHPVSMQRLAAAVALGQVGRNSSAGQLALIDALEDRNMQVVQAAAKGLVEANPDLRRYFQSLHYNGETDRQKNERIEALKADDSRRLLFVSGLNGILRGYLAGAERVSGKARAAVGLLVELGESESIELIINCIEFSDDKAVEDFRIECLKALVALAPREVSVPYLKFSASSPFDQSELNATAILLLCAFEDEALVEFVVDMLNLDPGIAGPGVYDSAIMRANMAKERKQLEKSPYPESVIQQWEGELDGLNRAMRMVFFLRQMEFPDGAKMGMALSDYSLKDGMPYACVVTVYSSGGTTIYKVKKVGEHWVPTRIVKRYS